MPHYVVVKQMIIMKKMNGRATSFLIKRSEREFKRCVFSSTGTMPVNTGEIIEFIQDITSNENVRVAVGGSVKGGLAVGLAATAGALLFGPVGLAVGGSVGGVGAAIAMQDKFKPLPQVIANMSQTEKEILSHRIERIMQEVNATDIIAFAALATSGSTLRGRVIEEVLNYVQQEMQLAIT